MKRWHDGRDRRSIRVDGFDYSAPGAYFVTICTHVRDHLFGEVVDGVMILNQFGQLLGHYWARTAGNGRIPDAHDFVVMPNHVHGIVWLPRAPTSVRWAIVVAGTRGVDVDPATVGARRPFDRNGVSTIFDLARKQRHLDKTDASPLQHMGDGPRCATGAAPRSLGTLIGAFKSMATRKINGQRNTPGLPVWQRGYHERIIRSEGELERVREYILDNPARWEDDPNNVA